MRVLIAVDKTRFDYLIPFSKALSKYNIECKIVNDLDIYDNSFFSKKILRWIKEPEKFGKLIREFSPDVVFTERVSQFSLLIIKKKIPLLVFLRGDYWKELKFAKETIHSSVQKKLELFLKNRVAEKCFENSTIILPICNYLTNIIKDRYPKKKISMLYQGIDVDSWKNIPKKKLKSPSVGLLQGAHIWGKAEEMLILDDVLDKFPNVTFYWAGDGPYRNKILPILNKHDNFKWLGHLNYPEKVREFLSEIDVYALISGMDMSPHSLLEASAMQKPVIATNVGGIPELMRNNETGFLVERGNSKDLCEKISLLINDKERAVQMGSSGRKFVEENFSWEKIAEDFVKTLKNFNLFND